MPTPVRIPPGSSPRSKSPSEDADLARYRLKTLFDALAAPQQAQQVQMGGRVTSEEQPMFVLLDDDNRITRVAVETDRLLSAPEASYVRLFIRVTTRVLNPSIANIELGLR